MSKVRYRYTEYGPVAELEAEPIGTETEFGMTHRDQILEIAARTGERVEVVARRYACALDDRSAPPRPEPKTPTHRRPSYWAWQKSIRRRRS